MKKKIIIDSDAYVKEEVREPINRNQPLVNNKIYEWLIYMVGYSLILIIVSLLSSSLYINLKYFGLYAFFAAVLIYCLNKTIKPILNFFTFPVNMLTLGLFYPVVNIIILKITSLLLGKNIFSIKGFIGPFFVVIIISFLDILMDGFIKGRKKWAKH